MELNNPPSKYFPLELVNNVLGCCHIHELFSVALANSTYRIEAENVLYGSVVLHSGTANRVFKTRSCLQTLAKVPSKADLVKSFELIYVGSEPFPRSDLGLLCESLHAMKSLKHLKLNFPWASEEDIPPVLNPALKQCTFSLTTLYIPYNLLLEDWVLSHKELVVIELHGWRTGAEPNEHQIDICKQLVTQSVNPLTLFFTSPLGIKANMIVAFPAFSGYTTWSAKKIADSLLWSSPLELENFTLFLHSMSEKEVVHDVLTSLAEYFPHLCSIEFRIEDPRIHSNPSSFSLLLQKFPDLEEISFGYYGGLIALTPAPYQENRVGLASLWASDCKNLREVVYPDGSKAERNQETMNWNNSDPNDG